MIAKNSKKTEYEKFMEDAHNKVSLPDDQLAGVVQEATGSIIEKKEKILKGEANQVFDITTKNDHKIIVRISKSEEPQFLQEKWAIEKCKKLELPTPEILLIKHLVVEGAPYSICVQRKIDGDTLERGNIDMNSLSEIELKGLILQAGEMLARIHTIKTTGFGAINGLGEGSQHSFDESIMQTVRRKDELVNLALQAGFDVKIMEQIIGIIISRVKGFNNLSPRLNHGDYGPKHLMIKGQKIVGIIDFGEVKSDTPIYDFAWWYYWFNDTSWGRGGKVFEWLKEGYTDKTLFNSDFEEIISIIKLNLGLEIFAWYNSSGYKEGVEAAKIRLIRDFNYFK